MKMDSIPQLGLDGVHLRQLRHGDLDILFSYLSIPTVIEHTGWTLEKSEDLRPLIESSDSQVPYSRIHLAIVGSEHDQLVGTVGLRSICRIHRTAEIGYNLTPEYWGRGIASAACNVITEWAFEALELNRVQARTLETNLRSEKVLKKCLFEFEGILRAHRIVFGKPINCKVFARLSPKLTSMSG